MKSQKGVVHLSAHISVSKQVYPRARSKTCIKKLFRTHKSRMLNLQLKWKTLEIFKHFILKTYELEFVFNSTNLSRSFAFKECIEIYLNKNTIIKNSQKSGTNYLMGLSIAFVQSISLGAVQVLIRRLAVKKVHFSVITLYTTYIGKFKT